MVDYAIGDWQKMAAVLRDMRRQRGLTQTQLAEQAKVSRAWLAKLEAGGHRRAEIEHVLRLSAALGVNMILRDTEDNDAKRAPAAADPEFETSNEPPHVGRPSRVGSDPIGNRVPSRADLDAIEARTREADARTHAALRALADDRRAQRLARASTRMLEEARDEL